MQADDRRAFRAAGPPAGIILAGGRCLRMGGGDKALALLDGKPMVQHVIDRIRPQVGELALSVERRSAALAGLGLAQVEDPRPGHHGPVGGLLAALRHFAGHANWLLLVPCDAPFLPRNLAVSLRSCAEASGTGAAAARYAGELQPTFSLWRTDLFSRLEREARSEPRAGLRHFLSSVAAACCDWPATTPMEAVDESPPPFFNVNDPAALERAHRWLNASHESRSAC